MPCTRWINPLVQQDCRVEVGSSINLLNLDQFCTQTNRCEISKVFMFYIWTKRKTILSVEDIIALIGNRCDGSVIGQVTCSRSICFLFNGFMYFHYNGDSRFFQIVMNQELMSFLKYLLFTFTFSFLYQQPIKHPCTSKRV